MQFSASRNCFCDLDFAGFYKLRSFCAAGSAFAKVKPINLFGHFFYPLRLVISNNLNSESAYSNLFMGSKNF
ncbi:MAG: hypothetical protein CMQ25_04955 [Gammaproteobacteria bacterium]|nr:hypothetical protein [Gammaproteobacteria bacterium]